MSSDSPATAIGHLKFDIKQSKISYNFAEQLLQKTKISGPADDRLDNFSKDALILEHNALFFKQCTHATKD